MAHHHFLLIIFPAQGHVNPALQFAKRLIKLDAHVTFVTSISAHRQITKTTPSLGNLSFATFSDGYDEGTKPGYDARHYMSELRRRSSEALPELIENCANEGHPVTCLIYSLLLPWAGKVARELHIPSALLWIQPATILDIYYYYFNGYGNVISDNIHKKDSGCIKLPGLPLLTVHDLPSHFITTPFALPSFKEHLETLCEEANPKVLVNTFDALEHEALRAINKLSFIAIGPLIPSAFSDGEDLNDTSFGGDLVFQSCSKNYIEWLDSKHENSVIYISFGSVSVLPKRQMEEMVRGLVDTGLPFLWVVRIEENRDGDKEEEYKLSEDLEKQGMVVPWCNQLEVLSHKSVGCFLTHCGWNSSLESLVCGVPVVAFPQWADQATNAKLIEDVWKTGVRMVVNEDGVVEGCEIKRCLEMVMGGGERGEEMRRSVEKWKELAREAVKDGESSDKNLKAFVNEVGKGL
nr:anthocyanin 5-O-glucosyltransferase [Paeonia suffruticosa]